MSDMFKLPCKLEFGETLIFTKKTAPYALHAINNHDALVEALESALEIAQGLDQYGIIHLEQRDKWDELQGILENAKGES